MWPEDEFCLRHADKWVTLKANRLWHDCGLHCHWQKNRGGVPIEHVCSIIIKQINTEVDCPLLANTYLNTDHFSSVVNVICHTIQTFLGWSKQEDGTGSPIDVPYVDIDHAIPLRVIRRQAKTVRIRNTFSWVSWSFCSRTPMWSDCFEAIYSPKSPSPRATYASISFIYKWRIMLRESSSSHWSSNPKDSSCHLVQAWLNFTHM